MFFDQNSGTPAHQDCYYLEFAAQLQFDSQWIALEDIDKSYR